MQPPSFSDVLSAHRRIRPYLPPTPLHTYPALNKLLGAEVYVKHENYQPVGAFKVRGGVNLVSQLSPDEHTRGIVASSTGNHGQSLAFAARLFGVKARIVVPENANPGKVAAMQGMGAEVIFHGAKFDDARRRCEALAAEQGYRYVHSGNEPLLIAGVATEAVEMLQEQPGLEAIIVPIGGGSGVAGACIVAASLSPQTRIIAVQSEAAPAAYRSWQERRVAQAPDATFAEGLATAAGFELPQQIMWEHLHEFMLVSDAEIKQAMVWMIEHAHTLAEAAGAAPLAAAYKMRETLRGKKIGLVCSGGNTSLEHLRQALNARP